ncbi:MAG: fucose isomerase, partial [Athalassotoga sp.]
TAGCEGDMPSAFTMYLVQVLTGQKSFMSNPSKIDSDSNEVIFAHCTVATSMTDSYVLRSHFESGIGVGISGHIPEGNVTVLKIGGENLDKYFVSEGKIVSNLHSEDRCRTQIDVQMDEESITYLLNKPFGNHHIIVKGNYKNIIEEFITYSNSK